MRSPVGSRPWDKAVMSENSPSSDGTTSLTVVVETTNEGRTDLNRSDCRCQCLYVSSVPLLTQCCRATI
jgi:hypothetical protein